MTTGFAKANGLDICYETIGDPGRPALLLVMGLGVQMIDWDRSFCEEFAQHGFFVIRYDNRDTGLSTRFDGHDTEQPAYTLADMADDGMELLKALGPTQAHLVGASMGGMIVQTMAIRHPDRVLSLCSIMSTTGAPGVARPTPEAYKAIVASRPESRDGAIEAAVATSRIMSGGGFSFDEDTIRRRAAAAYDRANYPSGKVRQVAAIAAGEDRTEALGRLRVPAVVIHGAADPLVPLSGGRATAAAIPGANLVVIPGMGHEVPAGARPQILAEIVANARRARTGPQT